MRSVCLSTAYFGPVQYFSHLVNSEKVFIEVHENYQRQSWRNRCMILGANEVISLNVPVVDGHSPGHPIRDTRISYHTPWQKTHQKSVESAYMHSPYYEYYIDDILPVWNKKHEFLLDLNLLILDKLYQALSIETGWEKTQEYLPEQPCGTIDLRNSIHPKSKTGDPLFQPLPYYQVFSDRFGFVPNLSILDLLFCAGPAAMDNLRGSSTRNDQCY